MSDLALLNYKQDELQKKLDTLTDNVIGIAKTAEVNNTTIRLMQQRMDSVAETQASHAQAIESVKQDRNKAIGGYIVISALCGLIVGGAIIAGVVYEIVKPITTHS